MLKLEVYLNAWDEPKNLETRTIIVNARNIAIVLDDCTHFYKNENDEEESVIYSTIYVGSQIFYVTRRVADSVIKHIEAIEEDDYNRDVLQSIDTWLQTMQSTPKPTDVVNVSNDISVRALESVDKMIDVLKSRNFNPGV